MGFLFPPSLSFFFFFLYFCYLSSFFLLRTRRMRLVWKWSHTNWGVGRSVTGCALWPCRLRAVRTSPARWLAQTNSEDRCLLICQNFEIPSSVTWTRKSRMVVNHVLEKTQKTTIRSRERERGERRCKMRMEMGRNGLGEDKEGWAKNQDCTFRVKESNIT